jgi:hypothetical protein
MKRYHPGRGRRLGVGASLFALFVAGCAVQDAPPIARENPPDVSQANVVAALKSAADSSKLQPPLEVSEPFPSPRISDTDWILCLRSAASDEAKRHPFAIFIKGGVLQTFRSSVITRSYRPFP